MTRWDDYRFVLALARFGSMTSAAKALKTDTATVSRHVHAVMDRLGVSIFIKGKGRWQITPEGTALVEIIERFENDISRVGDQIKAIETEYLKIRLTTLEFVCNDYLMSNLGAFRLANPNIGLEIICTDERLSLAYGEADIAIRLSRPQQGMLISRKIGEIAFAPYRHSDSPETGWIGLNEAVDWTPEMQEGFALFNQPPTLRVSTFFSAAKAARHTGLACILPVAGHARDFDLSPIPTARTNIVREVWVAYHETRKGDPGVKAVSDWATRAFST